MTAAKEPLLKLAGATLGGKYRLVSLLGSGGMGVVYRAEQLGLGGRSVAVKLLRRDLIATRFDWFRAEAMAASRINHPHAVAIYDFGVTPQDVPYLVMEHLRGNTLTSYIEQRVLTLGRIARIGAQVLSALSEAHACGVVHCDLTADNVIVERLRDGDHFAKVIDFGLARLFDLKSRESHRIGTAEYMAPEQIRGDLIQPATDLYAVGVLLYEMMAGQTPFAAGSVAATLDGHLNASPAPLAERLAECPPALSQLVADALEKSPDRRPASADEMRARLLAAVGPLSATDSVPVDHHLPHPVERSPLASGTRPQQALARGTAQSRRADRLTYEMTMPAPERGPFFGRVAELERALGFCRALDAGPGALAIVGEPGAGKARLALELGRQLGAVGRAYVAAADPSGLAGSWYPIMRLLEQVLGVQAPLELQTLARAVARVGLPERDVPGLAELFGVDGPASRLELAVRRREAHAAATRALAAPRVRFAPLVYCFVDVDEYDEASLAVVRALAAAPAEEGSPVRVVVTAREAAATYQIGARETIVLGGLEPTAARDMAVALAGAPDSVPDIATVALFTNGSPAAIEQLAGWIACGDSAADLPSLLVDLVSVRVNRLDVAARRVLQAVATHGAVAPRGVVEAMLSPEELASLEQPVWTGLLVATDATFTIPSELVASVVSACTPADVRRRLHRRALDAMTATAPTPAQLGHHAEHAGEITLALRHYATAGALAVRRFDDAGAARWYGRAVVMARELAARGIPDATRHLIDASLELADVLRFRGELKLALGALDEIAALPGNDRQSAASERTRALIALAGGDATSAVHRLQLAAGRALRVGARAELCQIYLDLAVALDAAGRALEADRELAQGIDVVTGGAGIAAADEPERLWRLALALTERHAAAGRLERARDVGSQALDFARRRGLRHASARVSAVLAEVSERSGDIAAAQRHRDAAIEDLGALGDRRSTAALLAMAREQDSLNAAALLSAEIEPRAGRAHVRDAKR
ncbi:MAG TPA: protein kinase [Kofleriaceae bacterium]|nr:protein kinase [Kofleriaceae bacterium]